MKWRDFPPGLPANQVQPCDGPTWWVELHFLVPSFLYVSCRVGYKGRAAPDGGRSGARALWIFTLSRPVQGILEHSQSLLFTCRHSLSRATHICPWTCQVWQRVPPSLTGHSHPQRWRWAVRYQQGLPSVFVDSRLSLFSPPLGPSSLPDCLPCELQAPALETKTIAFQRCLTNFHNCPSNPCHRPRDLLSVVEPQLLIEART